MNVQTLLAVAALALLAPQIHAEPADEALIQRGRYLVRIAGCNDCHTPGYAQNAGAVPESQWLTGDALGWSGPWGTTYAANLRLLLKDVGADAFVQWVRHKPARPPMPWFNLRDMTDADLHALLAYVQHLGPAGEPAPAWIPPGEVTAAPVVVFPSGL